MLMLLAEGSPEPIGLGWVPVAAIAVAFLLLLLLLPRLHKTYLEWGERVVRATGIRKEISKENYRFWHQNALWVLVPSAIATVIFGIAFAVWPIKSTDWSHVATGFGYFLSLLGVIFAILIALWTYAQSLAQAETIDHLNEHWPGRHFTPDHPSRHIIDIRDNCGLAQDGTVQELTLLLSSIAYGIEDSISDKGRIRPIRQYNGGADNRDLNALELFISTLKKWFEQAQKARHPPKPILRLAIWDEAAHRDIWGHPDHHWRTDKNSDTIKKALNDVAKILDDVKKADTFVEFRFERIARSDIRLFAAHYRPDRYYNHIAAFSSLSLPVLQHRHFISTCFSSTDQRGYGQVIEFWDNMVSAWKLDHAGGGSKSLIDMTPDEFLKEFFDIDYVPPTETGAVSSQEPTKAIRNAEPPKSAKHTQQETTAITSTGP